MAQLIIWKVTLNLAKETMAIMLPKGAVVLTIDKQLMLQPGGGYREEVQLWATVDPTQPVEPRVIRCAGTGHPLDYPDNVQLDYINTIQQANGQLVWHFFEVITHG